MNYTPGPAEQLSQIKDFRERARIKNELAKKNSNYLMGVVEGGREITGYLSLRNFLKNANLFNYGCSKIFEPFEIYTSAVEILTERDLKNAELPELKRKSKISFLEDLSSYFSPFFNERLLRKRVAERVLKNRCPKIQRTLF